MQRFNQRTKAIAQGRLRPFFIVGAVALLLATLFMGIGSLDVSSPGGGDDDDSASSVEAPAGANTSSSAPGYAGGGAVPEAEASTDEYASEAPASDVGGESEANASRDTDLNAVGGAPEQQRIIRTADVQVTLREGVAVNDALGQIRGIGMARSGYILASNSSTNSDYEYGSITLRVPSDQFEQALADLRGSEVVGTVDSEETSTQDVTGEFIDNESRLRALRATEARFLELLGEASDIDSVLRIEYELSTVRAEIETIEGRQQYLDTMTTYSTITVNVSQEGSTNQIADAPDDDPFMLRIANDSWDNASGALEGLLRVTLTLGIVAIGMLPAALLIYLLFRLWKAIQRRQEQRAAMSGFGAESGD